MPTDKRTASAIQKMDTANFGSLEGDQRFPHPMGIDWRFIMLPGSWFGVSLDLSIDYMFNYA